MADLNAIARALDLVEDHLQEPIGVADMADAAGYSLWHFCRTFGQAAHITPYDYLMRRRLAEAARALRQSPDKIIDIALDFQFNNPETFSRAFKRVFGLPPSQWREEGCLDRQRIMPRLTPAHLRHLAKGPYLKPQLVDREALRLAGLMTTDGAEPDAVRRTWSLLAGEMARAGAATGRTYYGLACYQEGRGAPLSYLAAFQIEGSGLEYPALVTKSIPACRWAQFVHKGARDQLPLTLDYVYHIWYPRSRQRLSLPWVLERYGPHPPAFDDAEAETAILIPLAG